MITTTQLQKILPDCKEPAIWANLLSDLLPKYGITSKEQTALFIAQCGHESSSFNVLEENLNYSLKGLRATFSKYFPTDEIAAKYARQPQRIASRVYANRYGNGDEASGDGWTNRGRGLIGITFLANYTKLAEWLGKPEIVDFPDLLKTKEYAVLSAIWFWNSNGVNKTNDIVKSTKIINGGLNGIEERKTLHEIALKFL